MTLQFIISKGLSFLSITLFNMGDDRELGGVIVEQFLITAFAWKAFTEEMEIIDKGPSTSAMSNLIKNSKQVQHVQATPGFFRLVHMRNLLS